MKSVARIVLLLSLSLASLPGCGKSDPDDGPPLPPGGGPDGGKLTNEDGGKKRPGRGGAREETAAAIAAEDPKFIEFLKGKGWELSSRIVSFDMEDRFVFVSALSDMSDTELSPEDWKMLVSSRSTQSMPLANIKNLSDDMLKDLAAMPSLKHVIIKGDNITDAGIKHLAGCKKLAHVTLWSEKVTDEGVKALAGLPLESLSLMQVKATGAGFEPFAGSKTLRKVELGYVPTFTDDGARHLAKLPNLDSLEIKAGDALTSSGIRAIVDNRRPAKFVFEKKLIDDALLKSLVAKGWLYGPKTDPSDRNRVATAEELTHLDLSGMQITDAGFDAITHCVNLQWINANKTGITDESLKKLAAFKKLETILLDETKITSAGIAALAATPIKEISLEGIEVNEDAFKAFRKMASLENLRLYRAKFQAGSLAHLAGHEKLKVLVLMYGDFNDAAVPHVLTLVNLEELVANDTMLGDEGFKALLKLPKLKSFLVDSTKVTKEVYLQAKKDNPKIGFYFYKYDQ